nr:ribonuclease H-like domain-containing protein [Tanacetum cinerariifolium]
MESLNPQVVAAAKLHILNPNEFDLWKMRIEQYFLMKEYSLWEVILNGDSPTPTRIVNGVVQDSKSLMEAIEKRFGGNKETKKVQKTLLSQQYENFSGTSSESLDDRLQKLISHLEILVNVVLGVSDASSKATVSSLPNVDSLSDVVIYTFFASQSNSPQLENEDLKQIDADYLEEMDLKWQMAMLTMRARREANFPGDYRSPRDNRNKDTLRRTIPVEADEEPPNYALMAYASSGSSSSSRFDNEAAPCSKAYDSMPISPVTDRYKSGEGYHDIPPSYTGTFMPLKPDLFFNDAPNASETVTNTSDSKDKFEIEYVPKQKEPIFVQTSKHVKTPKTSVKEVRHPTQAEHLRTVNQKSRGHKNNWNRKACYVRISFDHLIKDCDYYEKQMVQKFVWNSAMRVNHQNSTRMTHPYSNRHVVPTTVLTRSRLVSINVARPVSTVVPQSTIKSPRPVQHVVNNAHSPIRRPINHRPAPKNSNFHRKVTTVKVNKVNDIQGNPQQALKDKGVIDSSCSRHMTGNISFLSYFKEINGGYVAFGGNPKGGKITGKEKIKIGKLDFNDVYFVKELKFNHFSVSQMCDKKNSVLFTDTNENHVLLRVPKENNMYNVDLKNVVPLGELTCLFAKATLDESNLWHRRLGHINFKTMNKLVKGNLFRGLPSKIFENNHTCVACKKGKKHRASWSGPKWLFDIDTLTQSMNYQPVVAGNQPNHNAGIKLDACKVGKETVSAQQYVLLPLWSIGSQDPQNTDDDVAFDVKENKNDSCFSNTNRVNVASAHVNIAGPNPTNSTNSFNTASPSDTDVSSNFGIARKFSFLYPSNYPDDPDMPALEDIVYSDYEEDVGEEADLSNFETNISFSPVPTTRVHKYHPVTQIIGDLTLAPQTKSMARMVKEQGGLTQINNEDFHTCMFACFLSQEETKRVHQALKDPSWIEAMQEELLQFKMQKVWVLVDLPKRKRAI